MRQTIIILLVLLLHSCASQKILLQSEQGKKKNFEIGQFNSGCCGCIALYYSLFDDKGIKEQLIFETSCGIGKPTVFHFIRDSKGAVQDIKRFIAVSDSTAEFKFDSKEKTLLAKLDSIAIGNSIRINVNFMFADLVGYKEEFMDGQFHPFWIDEKRKTKFGTEKK